MNFPVFDLHCDSALALLGDDMNSAGSLRKNELHIDLERAKELLQTTRLQIQTVALHCGIVDVHYFSKIFKKVTGQTPKEYRDSSKR